MALRDFLSWPQYLSIPHQHLDAESRAAFSPPVAPVATCRNSKDVADVSHSNLMQPVRQECSLQLIWLEVHYPLVEEFCLYLFIRLLLSTCHLFSFLFSKTALGQAQTWSKAIKKLMAKCCLSPLDTVLFKQHGPGFARAAVQSSQGSASFLLFIPPLDKCQAATDLHNVCSTSSITGLGSEVILLISGYYKSFDSSLEAGVCHVATRSHSCNKPELYLSRVPIALACSGTTRWLMSLLLQCSFNVAAYWSSMSIALPIPGQGRDDLAEMVQSSDWVLHALASYENPHPFCGMLMVSSLCYILAIFSKFNNSRAAAGVEVTLVDANHCPGAVQFLFRLPTGEKYVHCGDMRFSPKLLDNPLLAAFRNCTAVYLDTTYCNPRFTFPPQASLKVMCCLCTTGSARARIWNVQGHEGAEVAKHDPHI